jgi:hypothetical protein
VRILERLLGEHSVFVLVKAHAVDPRHAVFAVEAFVHATKARDVKKLVKRLPAGMKA